MMKKLFLFILLFLCPALYGQQAENRTERIINFHSDIIIHTTGVIRSAETIKVYANGDVIKRGIFRTLPVYRKDKYGNNKRMTYNIISVLRDGQKETYRIDNSDSNYIKIYIGKAEVFLKPGIYEYVITYESPGQIGFFDDYDELYWNVTGTEWSFAIEQASAAITLPGNAKSINRACYTGPKGSTAKNCSSQGEGNKVNFKTGRSLKAREGLTAAVSFPRDIIERPPAGNESSLSTPPTEMEQFWSEYKYPVTAALLLFICFFYFYFTWRKAGIDPEHPIIIPTFNPPHGRSAAATRYLYKRNCDNKLLTAVLTGMAIKKAIRIVNVKKSFTLEPIEKNESLNEEEKIIYDRLFKNNESLKVSDVNYSEFQSANAALKNSLEADWNLKDYFLTNLKYVVWGTLLTLAAFSLYFFIIDDADLIGSVIGLSAFLITSAGFAIMSIVMTKQKKGCFMSFVWYSIFFFCSLIALASAWALAKELMKENPIHALFVFALSISYGLYLYLIRAYTKLGAQTLSELKGFRLYLKTAEENRLNLLTPPEKTPELFEKLLPYAIALDVENKWGEKFANVLQTANYNPEWYDGGETFNSDGQLISVVIASALAGAFASSLSSANTDPSSDSGDWDSGSGGGGSSDGGGGGGGGGGW